jgi:hypothetical protein
MVACACIHADGAPSGHAERSVCGVDANTAVSTESYDGCQPKLSEYPSFVVGLAA